MKIISSFKDFYDFVHYNPSEKPVYLRETKLFKEADCNDNAQKIAFAKLRSIFRVYPNLWLHPKKVIDKKGLEIGTSNILILSIAGEFKLFSVYKIRGKSLDISEIVNLEDFFNNRYYYLKETLEAFRSLDLKTCVNQFHEAFNSPIIIIAKTNGIESLFGDWVEGLYLKDFSIIINPSLSPFKQAFPDMFKLYQDIETFLGKSQPEEITTTGSDEDLIKAKGFDVKKSFRKGKEK